MGHLHHFCDALPRQPYVDMRPEFSFEEDMFGLITAVVTLPNSVGPTFKSVRGLKAWKTERAAMKDAAFQCYAALFDAGLLNDNLLPLTRDWNGSATQFEDLPAFLALDHQIQPFIQMAQAWSTPELHQTEVSVQYHSNGATKHIVMLLTTPMKMTHIPPFPLYLNPDTACMVTLGESAPRKPIASKSLATLREITRLLHQSMRSKLQELEITDYVALFSPSMKDELLPDWLDARCGRKSALNAFQTGIEKVDTLVRTVLDYETPHTFVGWRHGTGTEPEKAVEIECRPLPRRRNFMAQCNLSSCSTQSSSKTFRFAAGDCTIDDLPFKYSQFSLLIPSIMRYIEVWSVANQLRNTILSPINIGNIQYIVDAIVAPSAKWITNYQKHEFIGDAVLKFTTSVQLFSDHESWPEGYLSKRRDCLVSNNNLARAALAKGLDKYILTKLPKIRKWSPPRISDANQPLEKRKVGKKVLADVVEALIGAAYLDSGFDEARSCINIFIPEIGVAPPPMGNSNKPCFKKQSAQIEIENMIGYKFKHNILLLEALTHPTCRSDTSSESYQRLEFLGDAVLDMLVAQELSKSKHVMSEGDMTRLKATITNAHFLGFICMTFNTKRDVTVRIAEKQPNVFKPERGIDKVQLWRYMRHHSQDIMEAQKTCNKRHEAYSWQIKSCLDGDIYPWALLAQLHPDKFYSDIIESIIGAIFVDSDGNLSACQAFIDQIGIGAYLRRFVDMKINVFHPRESLNLLTRSKPTKFKVVRDETDANMFQCQVWVDGIEFIQVKGCSSREGAYTIGADAAAKKYGQLKVPLGKKHDLSGETCNAE
jgi:dsRNA-specific ribonuclease